MFMGRIGKTSKENPSEILNQIWIFSDILAKLYEPVYMICEHKLVWFMF